MGHCFFFFFVCCVLHAEFVLGGRVLFVLPVPVPLSSIAFFATIQGHFFFFREMCSSPSEVQSGAA
jgi:hypothetical protein